MIDQLADILSGINFTLIHRLAFLIFILSSLFGTGLSLTLKQIWQPLKDVRLVVLSLVANFVLVPLLVYLILSVLPLSESVETGFVIMAVASGPPILPKLAQIVNGNLAFSVGLMILLMGVSVFYMPIVLPLMLHGVQVSAWEIAKPLLISMVTPLAIGLFIKAKFEKLATTLQPRVAKISNISVLVGLSFSLVLQFGSLVYLVKTGAILAIASFIAISFGLGYLLGGPGSDTQRTLAVGTAQRNIAAALLVAGNNFDDPTVISVIIVTSLSMFVVMLLVKQSFAETTQPLAS